MEEMELKDKLEQPARKEFKVIKESKEFRAQLV
jgi:hypothetical protein